MQPTTRLSLNALGIQAINGKSFVSFLDNTKTFEMMKFMVTITIQNIENEELKSKLEKIIYFFKKKNEIQLAALDHNIREKPNCPRRQWQPAVEACGLAV